MTQTGIPSNYEVAQHLVRCGAWTIDATAGDVCGLKGEPFRRTNSWGYIQVKFRRPEDYRVEVAVLAHRVIWEAVNGPLAPGVEVNHINGVKDDNRIENLEAVTPAANVQHAFATGLNRPNRATAKLTPDQAVEIYQRCQAGERDNPIAAQYGVNRSVVNNIRNGWTWTHVTGAQPSAPAPTRTRPSRSRAAKEERDADRARQAAMGT